MEQTHLSDEATQQIIDEFTRRLAASTTFYHRAAVFLAQDCLIRELAKSHEPPKPRRSFWTGPGRWLAHWLFTGRALSERGPTPDVPSAVIIDSVCKEV